METTTKKTSDTHAEEITKSNSNSKQLLEQVPINDTPFTAIRMEDKWFLALGKYRLTNQLGSLEECKAEAQDASWIRIMQIMKIVIQEHEAEKQLNETITKQKEEYVLNQLGKIPNAKQIN